jgi:hypothetical protein
VETAPDLCAAVNQLLHNEKRPALSQAEVENMIGDGMATLTQRVRRPR